MEELENTLNAYNDDKYEFGKYQNEEDIKWAYFNNKIFVFKGGFSSLEYFLFTLLGCFIILFITIGIVNPQMLITSIIICIVISFIYLMPLTKLGKFLVISKEGVYFKKSGKPKYFSWLDVENLKIKTKIVYGFSISYVNCILKDIKNQSFNSRVYKRREFPRKGYNKLFQALFEIYWESTKYKEI